MHICSLVGQMADDVSEIVLGWWFLLHCRFIFTSILLDSCVALHTVDATVAAAHVDEMSVLRTAHGVSKRKIHRRTSFVKWCDAISCRNTLLFALYYSECNLQCRQFVVGHKISRQVYFYNKTIEMWPLLLLFFSTESLCLWTWCEKSNFWPDSVDSVNSIITARRA